MTPRKAAARPKSRPGPDKRASVERITYQHEPETITC